MTVAEEPFFGTPARYCGEVGPEVTSKSNTLTVIFKSDQLYRYRGFKCRYRGIQPNGIAVMNSFDDDDDGKKRGTYFEVA
jgi:hypothetical protein